MWESIISVDELTSTNDEELIVGVSELNELNITIQCHFNVVW